MSEEIAHLYSTIKQSAMHIIRQNKRAENRRRMRQNRRKGEKRKDKDMQ